MVASLPYLGDAAYIIIEREANIYSRYALCITMILQIISDGPSRRSARDEQYASSNASRLFIPVGLERWIWVRITRWETISPVCISRVRGTEQMLVFIHARLRSLGGIQSIRYVRCINCRGWCLLLLLRIIHAWRFIQDLKTWATGNSGFLYFAWLSWLEVD